MVVGLIPTNAIRACHILSSKQTRVKNKGVKQNNNSKANV